MDLDKGVLDMLLLSMDWMDTLACFQMDGWRDVPIQSPRP